MRRIREAIDRPLRWAQPGAFSRDSDLLARDEVVATLRFRSAFGSLANGDSADGSWTFKRTGFIATSVSIRRQGSDTDVAVFRNNTWSSGGTLELPDGRQYPASSNFWKTRFDVSQADGTPLITFERVGGFLRLCSEVRVHAAAASLSELPWLLMLGWYLTVMQHRDAAAMAAS
jgi:hypothetical protein